MRDDQVVTHSSVIKYAKFLSSSSVYSSSTDSRRPEDLRRRVRSPNHCPGGTERIDLLSSVTVRHRE